MLFSVSPTGMSDDAFLAAFGSVYEHSDWVARAILTTGLSEQDNNVDHLAGRMARIVDAAGHERQMALLRAHPELAGKLAIDGGLTAASSAEQAGAGLDKCSPEEFASFTALNNDYTTRFGHPFIIAVAGLDRSAILAAFTRRVKNDAETEFNTALAEVHKIARLRLEQMAM